MQRYQFNCIPNMYMYFISKYVFFKSLIDNALIEMFKIIVLVNKLILNVPICNNYS